jgi:hypothetical protein
MITSSVVGAMARLTELGLPTPNLFCGEHNAHRSLEWVNAFRAALLRVVGSTDLLAIVIC